MSSDETPDNNLSFLDHLEELRSRLIKSLLAVTVGVIIAYSIIDYPLEWLMKPMVRSQEIATEKRKERLNALEFEVAGDGTLKVRNWQAGQSIEGAERISFFSPDQEEPLGVWRARETAPLIYLRPIDPFMIPIKASLLLGMVLALPVILYQLWAFVAPGLLANEKKLVIPLIVAGTLLFPLGAAFAYFLLDFTLLFFSRFVLDHTMVQNDARAYLSFVLTMMLAFGFVFELPLAIVLATRTGLVKVSWLAERRPHIFIVLLVLAAVITPTGDPVTLMAMALPLQVLFEISLVVSRFLDRRSGVEDEAGEKGEDDDFYETEPPGT